MRRAIVGAALVGATVIAACSAGAASAAGGLVVGNVGTYRSGSALYAFGEITNRGGTPAGDVGVEVGLYNRGQRVARGVDLTIIRNVLNPGQKAVFYALLSDRPRRFSIRARAVEQVGRDDALAADYTSFRVSHVRFGPSYAGSAHGKVSGRIRNVGSAAARVSDVNVALYDRRGRLLRVGEGQLYPYSSTQVVAPRRSAPFEVTILDYQKVGAVTRTVVYVRAGVKRGGYYYS